MDGDVLAGIVDTRGEVANKKRQRRYGYYTSLHLCGKNPFCPPPPLLFPHSFGPSRSARAIPLCGMTSLTRSRSCHLNGQSSLAGLEFRLRSPKRNHGRHDAGSYYLSLRRRDRITVASTT